VLNVASLIQKDFSSKECQLFSVKIEISDSLSEIPQWQYLCQAEHAKK